VAGRVRSDGGVCQLRGACQDYRMGVAHSLTTARLRIRDWTVRDADAALATYGVA